MNPACPGDIAGNIFPVLRMKAIARSLDAQVFRVGFAPPQDDPVEGSRFAEVYRDPGCLLGFAFPISGSTAIGSKVRGVIVVRGTGLVGGAIEGDIDLGAPCAIPGAELANRPPENRAAPPIPVVFKTAVAIPGWLNLPARDLDRSYRSAFRTLAFSLLPAHPQGSHDFAHVRHLLAPAGTPATPRRCARGERGSQNVAVPTSTARRRRSGIPPRPPRWRCRPAPPPESSRRAPPGTPGAGRWA